MYTFFHCGVEVYSGFSLAGAGPVASFIFLTSAGAYNWQQLFIILYDWCNVQKGVNSQYIAGHLRDNQLFVLSSALRQLYRQLKLPESPPVYRELVGFLRVLQFTVSP